MGNTLQQKINQFIFNLVYWLFTVNSFVLIRYYHSEIEVIGFNLQEALIHATIGGGVIGGGISLLQQFNFFKTTKRRSFSHEILYKTAIYSFVFVCAIIGSTSYNNTIEVIIAVIFSNNMLITIAYLSFFGFIYHIIYELDKKFGPGVLLDFIKGKYYQPKEENRMFMFLDLVSSTTIAEKLGHRLYSRFIQDCFADLREPIVNNKASVYQYVGDEVVLTWKTENGIKNSRFLNFYFDYKKILEGKSDYFLSKYGVIPSFTAGVCAGNVMVAEVGVMKSEIAFHGDVLNTASRLQGVCKSYKQNLILDRGTYQLMDQPENLIFKELDRITLRGKTTPIELLGVAIA